MIVRWLQGKRNPNGREASVRSVRNSEIQERIDRIHWYHEFDFGHGLRAQVKTPDDVLRYGKEMIARFR